MLRHLLILIFCLPMATSANAQKDSLELPFGGFGDEFASENSEPTVQAVARAIAPGRIELDVTATVPVGYYIYSMNTPFGTPTEITLDSAGLIQTNVRPDRKPKVVVDSIIDATMEKYFDGATWTMTLAADSTIKPGMPIKGQLSGQYCNEGSCVPIQGIAFETTVPEDFQPGAGSGASGSGSEQTVFTIIPKDNIGNDYPVEFRIELSPSGARPGEFVDLTITADVASPYHIYSTTMSEEAFGTPTELQLTKTDGLTSVNSSFSPLAKPIDGEGKTEYHEGKVTWTQKLAVNDTAYGVDGKVRFQLCKDESCLPPGEFNFRLTAGQGSSTNKQQAVTATGVGNDDNQNASVAWLPFIITGMGFGFVSLLTPCVFPMIPVTISFFLKQGEDKPGETLKLAIIYCLSIIGAFTALGVIFASVFGAAALGQFATNGWLNLAFAAIFFAFALMLLGVFELQMPSWLINWSSNKQSSGGLLGVVFMALTFTLVSFTCTFAFVGQLLVLAAEGNFLKPIVGMMAFSSAFASPFLILALFPGWLKKMPKSGGWMNAVKVTFGLFEIAIVAKFLSVADTYFSPTGTPRYLDYHLVMGSWIAVSAVIGFYLLGMFRLPHDSPNESIGAVRCLFSLSFIGLAAYISVGMFSMNEPEGALWQQIVAFAPPQIEYSSDDDGFYVTHDDLKYQLDYDQAVSEARESGQPLFVDFTGVDCINCRRMEKAVIEKPSIHNIIKDMVRAQLYTDKIPGLSRGSEDFERILSRNHQLQAEWLRDSAIPAYVIVSPDGSEILAKYTSAQTSVGDFQQFLTAGLERWKQSQVADTSNRSKQTVSFTK